MPSTWSLIAALQGPARVTFRNQYVPLGIRTLLGFVEAQADFQAVVKA